MARQNRTKLYALVMGAAVVEREEHSECRLGSHLAALQSSVRNKNHFQMCQEDKEGRCWWEGLTCFGARLHSLTVVRCCITVYYD